MNFDTETLNTIRKNIQKEIPLWKLWFIQCPVQDNLMTNFLWVIIVLVILKHVIQLIFSIFKQKKVVSHLGSILFYLFISVIFAFSNYRNNFQTLMYISYPKSAKPVRSSIEDFINDASITNPNVVEYNRNDTYVYLKKNILRLLQKNSIVSSELFSELTTLFKKYEYVPIAKIEDNTLKSLSNGDFIQISSSSTVTATTPSPDTGNVSTEGYTIIH